MVATGTALLIGGGILAGGAIGGAISGTAAANAQGDAAEAQLAQRRIEREAALGFGRDAMAKAEPTMAELDELNKQNELYSRTLSLQKEGLQRQEALLNATDPTLIEAAKQAGELLNGKEAAILRPIRTQRDRDRQRLVTRLRQQMGSGAETSTAGIQALNAFDEQTDGLIAQAQDQATGRLLTTTAQVRPDFIGDVNRSASVLGSLTSSRMGALEAIQGRRVNAATNMIAASNGSSVAPYAGAPFVADYEKAKVWGDMFKETSQVGGKIFGAAAGKAIG